MSENNYKEERNDREFNQENENRNGQSSYMPNHLNYNDRGYTDSFYEDDYKDSGAGSFLLGAVVGGVIGAAAALFLAPKSGKEMREDLSTQAVHLKEKGIEISTVAKDKAEEYTAVAKDKAEEYATLAKDKAEEFTTVAKDKAEVFTSLAKEKTDEVTKSVHEQSEQLVDKVKSMTSKISVPMDDGTASLEGEEAIDFVDKVEGKVHEKLDTADKAASKTADAVKENIEKKTSN